MIHIKAELVRKGDVIVGTGGRAWGTVWSVTPLTHKSRVRIRICDEAGPFTDYRPTDLVGVEREARQ